MCESNSRRPGFPVSVTCGIVSTSVMPASRHQDHTTLPSASGAFVASHLMRPSLPPPNARDDRETPLLIGHGMKRILPVILGGDQPHDLRPINATGKSGVMAEIVSSDEQLLPRPCPGRGASRSGAAQIRDPRHVGCRDDGPRISSAPRCFAAHCAASGERYRRRWPSLRLTPLPPAS